MQTKFEPQTVAEHVVSHRVWLDMPASVCTVVFVASLVAFAAWYYTRPPRLKVIRPPSKHPLD